MYDEKLMPEELEELKVEGLYMFTKKLSELITLHRMMHGIKPTIAFVSRELYSFLFESSIDIEVFGVKFFKSTVPVGYEIILGY